MKISDRRSVEDRRRQHVKAFFYQFINPRRKNQKRRSTDSEAIHVDFHDSRLMVIAILILLFSIADIYATLTLVSRNGSELELNPFMKLLIDTDSWLFFLVKYSATAAAILILLSYRRFRFLGVTGLQSLYGVLMVYLILVVYEAGLFYVFPD